MHFIRIFCPNLLAFVQSACGTINRSAADIAELTTFKSYIKFHDPHESEGDF
jgi:hypothetical protein